MRSFYGGWIFELQWGPSMVIFSHGVVVEDKRRRSEKRHHPLGNKPWKKKLHHLTFFVSGTIHVEFIKTTKSQKQNKKK